MPEWNYYGADRRIAFESRLEPDFIAAELKRYQRVFGETFGIPELVELEKIRAMALVAEAINDAPEFLVDQIGQALNDSRFNAVSNSIDSVAEAISELKE